MNKKRYLILIGITIVGILLRFVNISPFNVYPDSYQNLIVAKNILNYHSVLGYMGPMGMIYPDFFSWTHPLYPLLIILATEITHNMTTAARDISFIAGILAIPLAYFFIKRVFSSSLYGLAGAIFMSLSFNHAVWSGFLMTETTGVFFMLLFLTMLFTNTKRPFLQNSLAGILFAVTVMTRYEYIVLIVPTIFLLALKYHRPISRIVTFLTSFILITAGITALLFPLPSTITAVLSQVHNLILQVLIIFFVFGILLCSGVFFFKKHSNSLTKYVGILAVILVWFAFIFFNNYFIHELLLSILSLIGFSLMLTKNQTRTYGFFSLISCLFLLSVYYATNPEMERYVTHLLPFLLIPASYGAISVIEVIDRQKRILKSIALTALLILVTIQICITYSGMRYSEDPSWYKISYEDKSAAMVKKYIANSTDILVTSYPEPYYYALNISTQSIADTYPYIFLSTLPEKTQIIIIEDMGLHDDFPNFTRFLDKNLSKNKIATFWIHEKFHYIATVQKEKYPVVIYKITLKELEAKINHNQ